MSTEEKAAELAKELVGNVQFYETQERPFFPGIAAGWPDVIPAPHTLNGRLKKVLTESLVTKLESALRAARREALEEAKAIVQAEDITHVGGNIMYGGYAKACIVAALDARLRRTLREEPSE